MSRIRNATHDEATEVLAFYEGMETGLSARIGGNHDLIITERDGIPFASMATHQLMMLPQELLHGAVAAGLPLGVLDDGRFHLDLQGAYLASRHSKAQTLRVTEHAARLFLYGRNVLAESILWADPSLDKGDACIVCNPRGEAMGIGTVVGSFKGKGEAVHPVHDLGTYLRDQDE
jgi:ribosome biogenesis protein Nip4